MYLLALVASIYYTFAYFNKDQQSDIELQPGDATITTEIRFDGVPIDSTSPYFDQTNNQIIINASDPFSVNALSKLSVQIQINSSYASRVRVKVMESYVKERYYILTGETLTETMAITENRDGFHPFSYLAYGNSYHMIRGDEGYQYYPYVLEEENDLQLNIIEGGLTVYGRENTQFIETITLRLSIIVEVVQANRYQQIWGIDPTIFQ